MIEIFVLAEEEIVLAFRMIAIEGLSVANKEEACRIFAAITHDKSVTDPKHGTFDLSQCKMLIISEDIAEMLGSDLTDWQLESQYPLIVEIPPLSGHVEERASLVDMVRQAIGIKIQ